MNIREWRFVFSLSRILLRHQLLTLKISRYFEQSKHPCKGCHFDSPSSILSLILTYKSLQYNKPSSISDLLTIQPTRSTRSSAVVTLQRPSNPSRLKISDRSFYFQAPALWNALPHHLRSHSHFSQSHSLLSLSSSQFHKQLKTHIFFIPILLSLSSLFWTDPLELWFGLFVIHYSFHILHPRSVHLLNSF